MSVSASKTSPVNPDFGAHPWWPRPRLTSHNHDTRILYTNYINLQQLCYRGVVSEDISLDFS